MSWVANIDNVDITTASQAEADEIKELIDTRLVVVIKNQFGLTEEEEVEFCSKIGDVQAMAPGRLERKGRYWGLKLTDHILRVTGKLNEHGEIGLFGHKETLDWHANQASGVHRDPYIWLYAAEGSKGSRTSWINCKDAYNDLDDSFKEEIENIKGYFGYEIGKVSPEKFFSEHVNTDHPRNIVHTNEAGLKGLFFPWLQLFGFEGFDQSEYQSITDKIANHLTQEKYIYHHDWEDGDVVISEQWLSLHKRWECSFMDKRILHRIAFGSKEKEGYARRRSLGVEDKIDTIENDQRRFK